ncbi:MAG: DEAD/DEAH box helicase [Eubacteriales bacterium]
MSNANEEILNSAMTAFIDSTNNSSLALRPQFISNDYQKGKKVLASLEAELRNCKEFIISVAFITEGGIAPLLQMFKFLEERGIPGKILTTNYLTFSEPNALRKLNDLKNIELRMFYVEPKSPGFHTKGYIFQKDEEIYKIIIGSSNLTLSALTRNKEWNAEIVSTAQGEITQEILSEFNELWNKSLLMNSWIEAYTRIYEEQKRIAKESRILSIQQYILEPNKMQVSFVENLNKLRESGITKALLISATGTGKTYASAFALRGQNPPKALFLVHRKQIAQQAIKSYKNVFGNTKTFGLLSGTSKQTDVDYLFATMQTMSKDEVMSLFKPDEFSMIVIDEAHHSAANSYRRIMNYFKPDFWLGMTASPDRTNVKENELSIYEIFDHNIAYEIRLQKAMEEDLLCPFQYFGITDIEIDGETITDETKLRNFSLLTSDSRVDYIIDKANYFGFSGDRVKGLIFCSRIDEARELSRKFNDKGLRTAVLTGSDNDDIREAVIERLAGNKTHRYLDYILSVDIFSEGLDIPEVNQVIMLRPTESPIVFIQQLGRGLRKSEGKEYVIILDFIGNYTNNFMIPIALSGDRTYNKDNIRKYVMEGSRVIPGSSSIHFDEISRTRIFASIDKVSTTKQMLRDKYTLLKDKLGHIPSIIDFYDYSEIDPLLFISYAGTYHHFLKMIEPEYKISLSEQEENTMEFISSLLANGKRPQELLALKHLLTHDSISFNVLLELMYTNYQISLNESTYESSIRLLEKKFINTQTEKKKYMDVDLIQTIGGGIYKRSPNFYSQICHSEFYQTISDLIDLGLRRYIDLFCGAEDNLVLYQKYSRKDVCRLLNWEQDDSSTIYGYKIKYGTCPIFVTYDKKDDISESTKYNDKFIDPKNFSWMTRSSGNWRQESDEIMKFKSTGLKIYLFVKKSDGEGTDFYYMGKIKPIIAAEAINTNGKPIMNIKMELEHSVRDDIYDYIS